MNHSDNLLDNRPALASLTGGKLLIVNSSDGRRLFHGTQGTATPLNPDPNSAVDPFNNDLWSHEVDLGSGNPGLAVVALGREARPDQPTVDAADAGGVRTLAEYRAGPDKNLHIVRGEFHRHSEISSDGGNDGTILDQWRYVLDAAGLDWVGCCDHDNGSGREYFWWLIGVAFGIAGGRSNSAIPPVESLQEFNVAVSNLRRRVRADWRRCHTNDH